MKTHSGFKFSKLVIIESLKDNEVPTGSITSEFVMNYIRPDDLLIEVIDCKSADHFLEIIKELTLEARSGCIPLLHVECHGCSLDGLEFKDTSSLNWEDTSTTLLPLNIATKFNLVSVFLACYAAHFTPEIMRLSGSPIYSLISPTNVVTPDEIMQGTRTFYRALFEECDIGAAYRELSKCKLEHGEWLCIRAESIYEMTVNAYLVKYFNDESQRVTARNIYRMTKADGNSSSVGSSLRRVKAWTTELLSNTYFDTYFLIDKVPENAARFKKLRVNLARIINEHKWSGRR
jgi:hypothetical protein